MAVLPAGPVTTLLSPDETETVATLVPHAGGEAGKARNLPIQWLRAAAAGMVLLHHAAIYQDGLLHSTAMARIFDERLALLGVSLFFAISGYLMATAIRAQAPVTFLAHRVIRIYPAFLAVLTLTWGLDAGVGLPFAADARSLLLAPVGAGQYPLHVEWTLVFELTFYVALFALAMLQLHRFLPAVALAWLAVLGLSTALWPDSDVFSYNFPRILGVSADVPMAGGLLIPTLLRRPLPPLPLIAAGAATWFAYSLRPITLDQGRWLFGIGGTLLLLGFLALSQRRPDFGNTPLGRFAARLGDHSYALYLCHVPLIFALYTLAPPLGILPLWLLGVALPLLAAWPLGLADVALYRTLKAGLRHVPATPLRLAIALYALTFTGIACAAAIAAREAARAGEEGLGQAQSIAARVSGGTVEAAFARNGFTPSPALSGAVDGAAWTGGRLSVTGWAGDRDREPVAVALFQGGRLLSFAMTALPRSDIAAGLHLGARTGFALEAASPCAAAPLTAIAFTPGSHRFGVLKMPDVQCR